MNASELPQPDESVAKRATTATKAGSVRFLTKLRRWGFDDFLAIATIRKKR